MFVSEFLNSIGFEQLMRDFKNDHFYISHHFLLLKEHIRYLNNYHNAMERRKDYLNVIELSMEFDIYCSEDTLRFFIFKIKEEMYTLEESEKMTFIVHLFMLITKYSKFIKDQENIYGKKDETVILRKYFLKELEEIHETLNNTIIK